MANRRDNQFFYTPHNRSTLVDCNFLVDSTVGAGISSLNASGRINSVFMHTGTIPSSGNPNPANGLIIVNLQDNYNKFLAGWNSQIVPVTGSDLNSGLSVGAVYVISVVGTTTRAQWTTAGLPLNMDPAVGVSFIAAATGVSGTGRVKAVAPSAVSNIQMIGNPNLMNSNGVHVASGSNGMQIILGCYGMSSAFTGSAMTAHNHDLIVKGGQAASTTNSIANYAGPILGKQEATDATYPGSASAANGGVASASAGTPAGTIVNSSALVAPTNGTLISLSFYLNNTNIGV